MSKQTPTVKENNNIVWVRWYMLYADGMTPSKDSEYDYIFYRNNYDTLTELTDHIKEDLEEHVDKYVDSEHYRRVVWEIIDRPPKFYIQQQLKWYNKSIKKLTNARDYFLMLEKEISHE